MAATVKQKKAKQARSHGKLPMKRSINLAVVGVKPINWLVAAPAIILIIAVAFLFSKIAVVDRFLALSAAQQRASQMQAQVDAAYAQVDSYGELVEEYAHYTYSGMTEEELALVDRSAVMDMIETIVMPRAEAGTWTLSGNQLELPITGATLQQINEIVQQLQEDKLVDFCTVSMASTNDVTVGGDGVSGGDVTAHVTVYLTGEAEGGDQE